MECIIEEEEDDRAEVLADARALKEAVMAWRHPEMGVSSGIAVTRNFFHRPSAPTSIELAEREEILADAAAMKAAVMAWRHPEIPMEETKAAVTRNYFTRPSAPEQESIEEAEARAQVLADAAGLKAAAVAWRHPEIGVANTSVAVTRNYFTRLSAPEQLSVEEADEQAQILEDAAALKRQAMAWRHPEIGVPQTSLNCARNYFSRASAPEQESLEEANERVQILEDIAHMKSQAMAWRHPEIGVPQTTVNCARNYFSRVSAPEQESLEEANERAQILADAIALKEQAMAWRHPEIGVPETSVNCARNYFDRASAPEQDTLEEANERIQILADASALKEQAVAWRHPEIGVPPTSANCARNYFNRGSVYDEHVHTENVDMEHAGAHEEDRHFDFDMEGDDEVPLNDDVEYLKANLKVTIGNINKPTGATKSDEDEGSLSRSPSSVMLFGLESGNTAY